MLVGFKLKTEKELTDEGWILDDEIDDAGGAPYLWHPKHRGIRLIIPLEEETRYTPSNPVHRDLLFNRIIRL